MKLKQLERKKTILPQYFFILLHYVNYFNKNYEMYRMK